MAPGTSGAMRLAPKKSEQAEQALSGTAVPGTLAGLKSGGAARTRAVNGGSSVPPTWALAVLQALQAVTSWPAAASMTLAPAEAGA
jgi:hypothetical protein